VTVASWRVKVYGGTDPLTGREIRLRKTCKTERAALIELGKLLEQAAAGRQPETNAGVTVPDCSLARCDQTWPTRWSRPGRARPVRREARTSKDMRHGPSRRFESVRPQSA
jgi:hypothetical protein